MERYFNITKAPQSDKKVDLTKKKLTSHEHIMHVATTASTRGHDIWQSASTGHQVSEAGGKSVSYNDARLAKLQAQFPPTKSTLKRKRSDDSAEQSSIANKITDKNHTKLDSEHIALFEYDGSQNTYHPAPVTPSSTRHSTSGIFSGCVFYLDGYMGSKMSDHSLRRVLTQNGGSLSLYLKKTRITHVLLSSTGALANSKIKKEVEGSRNRVKFVKVDWVFKCLEVGHRVGEWDYSIERLKGHNRSIAEMVRLNDLSVPSTSPIPKFPPQLSNSVDVTSSDTSDIDPEKDRLSLLGAEEGERLDGLDR